MDSDDIKYMAKKVLRLIFAGKKAKIILIIVLILLLILFMLLPASFYFITIDDGIWDDDEKGKPSNYTDNAKISTDATKMGIVVDKDTMVKNGLKDLGYDDEKIANMTDEDIIEVFKINKKLKKDPPITSLDELTQAELLWCLNDAYSSYLKKPAELEKLLNAELITQYPDLGPNVTELNGIIKFERHKADGSSEFLTYIDSNTFTGYVDSNNTDALKYFTLDEQGNALVAYSDKTTETVTSNDGDMKLSDYTDGLDDSNKQSIGNYSKTTITVSSVSINYKSAVEKYTMPFNYLWSLLVIGEDKDFVLELADLVENSEITISIYDNIVTTEDVNTYTYKKETRTDKYARLSVRNASGVSGYPTERYWSAEDSPSGNYDPRYQASYNTDSTEYKVTNTVINERNQIKYDLTKADVWIVDYSKEYDFPKDATSSVDSNSADLDDTAYTLNTETSVKGDAAANDSDILAFKQTVENFVKKKVGNSSTSRSGTGSGSKTSVTENKSSGSGNKSSGSGTAPIGGSTSGANSNSNSEEVEVVVVDAELKNYDHFVERKHTQTVTTTDKTYVAQTPVNNPKDDKNADTDNFVKILCKESHVEAKSYLTDGKTTSWLWEIMEKNCPDYIDLTKYLFYKVTGRSFGVDTYDFSEFEPSSFISSSGEIYGNSFEEKVWYAMINAGYSEYAVAGAMGNFKQESDFKANNLQLTGAMKKLGMTDEKYTEAVDNGTYTNFVHDGAGYGLAQWTYWSRKESFLLFVKSKGTSIGDENTQIEYVLETLKTGSYTEWEKADSIEKACENFQKEYERAGKPMMGNRLKYSQEIYEKYHGKTAPTDINSPLKGDNKIKMEALLKEAQRIANDDRYTYSQSNRFGQYQYDCSSLVYRLYYQFFGISVPMSTSAYGTQYRVGGATSVDLQPGDVLWRKGHVTIYIGNGIYVAAHGNSGKYKSNPAAQISVYNDSPSRYTYVYRFISN